MIIFGITGGSGVGKTLVSEIFSNLGVQVIDADIAARQVVEQGQPCLDEVAQYFGEGILTADKNLDRKKLADIVFTDPVKLEILNNITHKYIKEAVIETIEKSTADYIAIDGAALIGSNMQEMCHFIISVLSDYKARLDRIIKRDKLTEEQAKNRLNSQPDDKFYIENSHYLIYNNNEKENLEKQVKDIFKSITIGE